MLPEPVRLERLDLALTLIGAALGDRARQYLDGTRTLTDEPLFLADLVGMTTAMLRAPAPETVPETASAPRTDPEPETVPETDATPPPSTPTPQGA